MKKLFKVGFILLFFVSACTSTAMIKEPVDIALNTMHNAIFESSEGIEVLYGDTVGLNRYHSKENTLSLQNKAMDLQADASAFTLNNDTWYYLTKDVGMNGGVLNTYLYAASLDGKKETLVSAIDSVVIPKEGSIALGSEKVLVHKTKAYIVQFYTLYMYDFKDKTFTKWDLKNVEKICIDKDNLYVLVDVYDDVPWVLLQCDLDGNIQETLVEKAYVSFVDDNFIFYKKVGEENQKELYILNRNTKEEKVMKDTLNNYGVLKQDGKYVFETYDYWEGKRRIHWMDQNGKILASKEHDEKLMLQLLSDSKIYVSSYAFNDTWKFGYYEIKEDEIKDLVVLEER